LTKFAARDYEDMLQCLLPVMEGILPPKHDSLLQDVIFLMAFCQGLTRLRLHTDTTLRLLETVTTEYGKVMRKFASITCAAFATKELPKEIAARARRKAKRAAEQATVNHKDFNLNTYKHHSISGDYVPAIRLYGTTNSYSTRAVGFPIFDCSVCQCP
ncbi:hypothetical protein PLICRDRAFT_104196, partial [Plicaturopsis crispa FD-325 SS-3]